MDIVKLNKSTYKDWFLKKHYLKRMPFSIAFCFGLVNDGKLEGVCAFSYPTGSFDFSKNIYELSRLVLNEDLEDNILSWFLSQCLKSIDEASVIVSYADENNGHYGYIYQATNWIYTGYSSAEKLMYVNGREIPRRSVGDIYGTSSIPKLLEMGHSVEVEEQVGKHRYFQVTGNKSERRILRREISDKYEILPYPKGQNQRYDASYDPEHRVMINKFF